MHARLERLDALELLVEGVRVLEVELAAQRDLHGVLVELLDREGESPHPSPPPLVLVLTIPRRRANNLLAPSKGHGETRRRRAAERRRADRAAAPDGARGRGRARVPDRDRGRRRRRRRASSAAPAPAATPAPEEAARKVSEELPLSQQVGRLVVLRFAGTSAPGYVRRGALARAARPGRSCSATTSPAPTRRRRSPGGCSRAPKGRRWSWSTRRAATSASSRGRRRPRSQPRQAAAGSVGSDAEAAARALRATGDQRHARAGRRRRERPGRRARRPRVLDRLPGRRRGDGRVRARLARGRRRRRPPSTSPGIGGAVTNTDDGPATIERSGAADPRRGPRPVPRGDRGRRAARDGRPRALPRARRRADRLAVAADHRRACCATSSASTAS